MPPLFAAFWIVHVFPTILFEVEIKDVYLYNDQDSFTTALGFRSIGNSSLFFLSLRSGPDSVRWKSIRPRLG